MRLWATGWFELFEVDDNGTQIFLSRHRSLDLALNAAAGLSKEMMEGKRPGVTGLRICFCFMLPADPPRPA